MSTSKPRITLLRTLWPALAGMLFAPTIGAAALTLSTTPLFITPTVAPNILVIMDNSQSMDAYMAGTLVSGNNVNTRGNIGRSVMSSVITSYRSVFNWGLMSFELTAPSGLFNTYAYYMGSDSGTQEMVFTDDCSPTPTLGTDGVYTPGVSASNYNLPCVSNPQPFAGGNYVTYGKSADDPSILDVLYVGLTVPQLWGISGGAGTTAIPNNAYWIYQNHTLANSWVAPAPVCPSGGSPATYGDLALPAPFGRCPLAFSYTDAGFLPGNPPYTRQLYLPRVKTASGQCAYNANITGYGVLNEAVMPDSTAHFNNLMTQLGSETCSTSSTEIKNAAVYTPTTGTLISTQQYFAGTNGYTSPVTSSCQQNFTVLVTDGLPTGDTTGNLYSKPDRTNTNTPLGSSTWIFGAAAQDAINATCALRTHSASPSSSSCTGLTPTALSTEIPTYVLALSDTVTSPSAKANGSVAIMNAMAAGGGTGSAYFASTPATFTSAFDSIAADILGKIGAASSVATSSSTLVTSSKIYQAKFSSTTWSSDLLAFAISTTDGSISPTPAWQAGANSWITGGTTMTQAPSARNVFTYKTSTAKGIPFLWPATCVAITGATELDFTQCNALNLNISGTNDGLGSNRLNYLRGDASNEGTTPTNFRVRPANKLGDIIDSSPVFVSKPNGGFPATLESANYASFRTAKSGRTKMVYVGANDGMLHGIDTSSGQEIMAYVPSKVYANLSKLSALSYSHKYFVNGSPTVSDVFYGGAWHTVLVGSLAQGGQSVFALDITDPANFTQTVTNAQNMVLWEFNDTDNTATSTSVDGDSNLGYTLSQPAVGRVCTSWSGSACSTSKWVAIFGNGYNNTEADGNASTTGYAYLYVVDIQNGNLLAKISTNTGSTTTPNGLASPTIVDVNGDYYVDYVYAGDLQGNMWKFDLTSNASSWKVAYGSTGSPAPVYRAKDSTGTAQPITTRPQITTHPSGTGYLVFFGTGKYLEPVIDVATTGTQTQTFYGIWDNGATVSSVTSRNSTTLQQQAIDALDTTGNWRHTTLNTIDWTTQKGWYMDLCLNASGSGSCSTNYGEKQVSNSVLANGRIIFTTLVPDATACYGGASWIMELDFASGGRTTTSPFDVNHDGFFSSTDVASFGGSVGTKQANGSKVPGGIAGTPTLVFNPQNKTTYKYSNLSTGALAKTDNNLGQGIGRVSWRELLNE